jgi:hypothetical protein
MAAEIYIDGVEVTNYTIEGSATRRLNRSAQATIRLPIDQAIGDVGSRLKIVFDGDLFFHGTILMIEDQGDEDFGYSVYNASDPMELWSWRLVKDSDGDWSYPSILDTYGDDGASRVMYNALDNSIYAVDDALDPDGSLFIALDSANFSYGGFPVKAGPSDWPMTIAELFELLVSTGTVDIILQPIDSGGNMAIAYGYNGDYGTDLSGSVSFDYGMGSYNVRQVRRSVDMSSLVNKLQYLGGPKMSTIADPNATQHWCFEVAGLNAENYPDPPYTEVIAKRDESWGKYGKRQEVRIYDAEAENCRDPINTYARDLYRRLWLIETWIRSAPRELVHVTPTRGTGIGDFDIGDLVTVQAGSFFRGGFSGKQRIYAYTVSWDADGVLELGELQTSADQEGMS